MLGFYVLDAVSTDEYLLAAGIFIDAIVEGIRALTAVHAVAELNEAGVLQSLAKLVVHALIKDIHGAFPQAIIAILFAVAHDAAIDLVDLFEATVLHQRRQDLAANATGAVGHHRLILHPVILAGLDFLDEIMRGFHIGHDGIFKLANLRFHGVAAVKENDLLATFFYQLIYLFWLEVHAAANDAVFIHLQLARRAKGHDFIAHLDRKPREVIRAAFGPLELHALKARVFLGLADVALAGFHIAANGAVDAVLRNEDAPLEAQGLAQGALPQHDSGGIFDGGKAVIQENFANSHALILGPQQDRSPILQRE